jgi:hypothetical protein
MLRFYRMRHLHLSRHDLSKSFGNLVTLRLRARWPLDDEPHGTDRHLPEGEGAMKAVTWIRRKLDISPCTQVREALWWRLKHATLYDQKCSAESTREWFSWMFFHWLRTGRWESGWSEPNSLTPNQKADPCFQNKGKVSGTNRRGLKVWLWHVLAHRKTDYECEYCWDSFPAAG